MLTTTNKKNERKLTNKPTLTGKVNLENKIIETEKFNRTIKLLRKFVTSEANQQHKVHGNDVNRGRKKW